MQPTWDPISNPLDPLIILDMRHPGSFDALVAPFDACILNGRERPGVCVRPPRDDSGYEYAHTGGTSGVVPMGLPHADLGLPLSAAAQYYADTGYAAAVVTYREDDAGIWAAGDLVPGISERDRVLISRAALSGDWRWVEEERRHRMIASQVVLVPGFRKATAGRMQFALAASAGENAITSQWLPRPGKQDVVRAILAAATRHHPAGSAGGKGGQFMPKAGGGGGRVGTPSGGTRSQLVTRLRSTGYTGPTSYPMNRLREIAGQHVATTSPLRERLAETVSSVTTSDQLSRTPTVNIQSTPAVDVGQMNRTQIVASMRANGYAGPTSYNMTRLREIAGLHISQPEAMMTLALDTINLGSAPHVKPPTSLGPNETQVLNRMTGGGWALTQGVLQMTGDSSSPDNVDMLSIGNEIIRSRAPDGVDLATLTSSDRTVIIRASVMQRALDETTGRGVSRLAAELGYDVQGRSSMSVAQYRSILSPMVAARMQSAYAAPQQRVAYAERRAVFAGESAARMAASEAARVAARAESVALGKPYDTPRAQWNNDDALRFAVDTWEGTYPNGFRTKVTDVNMGQGRASIEGVVYNASGNQVGNFSRSLRTDHAYHAYLRLDPSAQGSGFASQFNAKAEAQYKAVGIDTIKLLANIDIGGYTWARQGYQIDPADAGSLARTVMLMRPGASVSQADRIRVADSIRAGDVVSAADMPGGKELLLGTTWHGTKKL